MFCFFISLDDWLSQQTSFFWLGEFLKGHRSNEKSLTHVNAAVTQLFVSIRIFEFLYGVLCSMLGRLRFPDLICLPILESVLTRTALSSQVRISRRLLAWVRLYVLLRHCSWLLNLALLKFRSYIHI